MADGARRERLRCGDARTARGRGDGFARDVGFDSRHAREEAVVSRECGSAASARASTNVSVALLSAVVAVRRTAPGMFAAQ
jgi:hypothetical protein